jgi:uncharacterized membrane protein
MKNPLATEPHDLNHPHQQPARGAVAILRDWALGAGFVIFLLLVYANAQERDERQADPAPPPPATSDRTDQAATWDELDRKGRYLVAYDHIAQERQARP